ncbi:MAG: pilus assembly protein [Brevundimonas sp.]|nr:MAG: pilus assembly protein [Brevundimonas sp.]
MRALRWKDERGSAAVEFALVGPLLILLLIGMVVYGGWFWLAQSVQSLASEAARASIAGLDVAERDRLAKAYVQGHADELAGLNPARARLTVVSDADSIQVRIDYDAHDHPVMSLAGLIPSPPGTIARTAVVRIGGY